MIAEMAKILWVCASCIGWMIVLDLKPNWFSVVCLALISLVLWALDRRRNMAMSELERGS